MNIAGCKPEHIRGSFLSLYLLQFFSWLLLFRNQGKKKLCTRIKDNTFSCYYCPFLSYNSHNSFLETWLSFLDPFNLLLYPLSPEDSFSYRYISRSLLSPVMIASVIGFPQFPQVKSFIIPLQSKGMRKEFPQAQVTLIGGGHSPILCHRPHFLHMPIA